MAPGVSICVQHDFAAVENVIRGPFVTTKFAFITVDVFPATKVCRRWQCVDASIDHEP